jgi:cell fate (sporulation/competence/biofilm development) regulator YlbF (YheA/YmcA/DUF963 family)
MELDTKIKDFASYILSLEEFTRYKKAREALQKDPEALNLLQEFDNLQHLIAHSEEKGIEISDSEKIEIENKLKKILDNQTCLEFIMSENAAIALTKRIAKKISDSIGFTLSTGGCCGGGCCSH